MDALDTLHAKIPQFPGYADNVARRTTDELIRSYLGEAFAQLNARHPDYFAANPDGYEALLVRAGFMNQLAFKSFEYAALDAAAQEAIAEDDLALVELADRAATVEAADVPSYVADLTAAFDARDAAMSAPNATLPGGSASHNA